MIRFLLTLCICLGTANAYAEQVDSKYLDEVFHRVAEEVQVPEKLIRAICWSESRFNSEAYNHGDGAGTNHAFGVCQVLHSTAKEMGFKDDRCINDFRDKLDANGTMVKASRTYKDCKLFGVYTSVYYGARYLKTKLIQYNDSAISAIAAYNTGSVRTCKTGKVLRLKDKSVIATCVKGGLLNQKYVDGVLKALEENR